MTRRAILLSATIEPETEDKVKRDIHPQTDYFALRDSLNAELISTGNSWSRSRGKFGKLRALFGVAWKGFRRRNDYDLIVTDLEHVGLILALLFKVTRVKRRHIMICHGKVARRWMLFPIKALRLHNQVDRFVCYSPAVAARLQEELGLEEHRVVSVLHPADHHFWRPMPAPGTDANPERLIVAAGMDKRDYPTLVKAVKDLGVQVRIAAFSPWVSADGKRNVPLPENIQFVRCTYAEMRDLYSRATCVAVPLNPGRSSSGSLVVYEAMAMGKPVLVTRTEGQESLAVIEDGINGYYIEPFQHETWKQRIIQLLDDRDFAKHMGKQARASVEKSFNMEAFANEMQAIVRQLEQEQRPQTAGNAVSDNTG